MAVEKMHLANIMVRLEDLDDFLENLIKMGDIEAVDAFTQIQNREFAIRATEENIDKTEDFNYIESFPKSKNEEVKELEEIKDYFDLDDNEEGKRLSKEQIGEIYYKLNSLIQRKKELEAKKAQMELHLRNLKILEDENIDVKNLNSLDHFEYRYGEVSADGRFILKNNYENIPSVIIHLNSNSPNKDLNKEALREVYAIDKSTSELIEDTQDKIRADKEEFNKLSLDLDREYEKNLVEKSNEVYDNTIKSADKEVIEIDRDFKEKVDKADKLFESNEDKLVEEFVRKIINEEE
ncbi:MAG: hypothetical protein SPI59_05855 [Finegoldia sp.]|nr:hypothetical protein [Finegoldia sp.]